jgi:hypothetical protein
MHPNNSKCSKQLGHNSGQRSKQLGRHSCSGGTNGGVAVSNHTPAAFEAAADRQIIPSKVISR